MTEWTKVVTNPLGLAGFALFLVFGVLAKLKRNDERRWLSPAAVSISAIALIGGLLLAYAQTPRSQPARPAAAQSCNDTDIKTSGQGSPVVNCANGPVNITVDQSSGTKPAAEPKTATPPPRQ
jgi:hypothetical protein